MADFANIGVFGGRDWAKVVLWDELPGEKKNEDMNAGGWYYKFVTSLMPSFDNLKYLIYKSREHVLDASTARKDLLEYIAGNFGIIPDLAEPEAFQRTKIEIAGRWRLIKGTTDAYVVLCKIHGFEVVVKDIWWDGSNYTTIGPMVYNETIVMS